jgi:ABC-type multidrug transport system fused ATPase/permease subunit
VATNPALQRDFDALADTVSEADLAQERRSKERADGARFIHWGGIALLGLFLVALINATPVRWTDPAWQLSVISLLMTNGAWALVGALLICLARLLNVGDRKIRDRALLVRNLASWVALGWLLLIPLQLFLSVRLINNQVSNEIGEIQSIQRISRSVANARSEDELRATLSQIQNQPPMPRLTVPLEVAKGNLLAQFQKNINAAKNRQEQATSDRWQTWLKEAFRNTLQCTVLGLGFLAIGKKRNLSSYS